MALKLAVDRICKKCGQLNVKDDGDYIIEGHQCPDRKVFHNIPCPTHRRLKASSTIINEPEEK